MRQFFMRMSIRAALTGTLAVFAALLMVMAALSYISDDLGQSAVREIDRGAVKQADHITRGNVQRLTARVKLGLYHDDLMARRLTSDSQKSASAGEIRQHLQRARDYLADFAKVPEGAAEQELVAATAEKFGALLDLLAAQVEALDRGDLERYRNLGEQQMAVLSSFNTALDAYYAHLDKSTAALLQGYKAKHDLFTLIDLALLAVAAVIILAVRFGLQRVVVQPLAEVVGHLQRLAKADLSQPIEITAQNEIGQLQRAMTEMQGSLSAIVGTVRGSSAAIFEGSQNISQGNADLSSRTEQQAASLQETAASMEQITSTVRQNADNARQASALANDASGTVDRGRTVVADVVKTMQGIADSSKQIASIINVIDSIAFQTNILALNASVEAARAGEQGRGFAVVAGEVRTLAGRSAEAAKEIKVLIQDSTRRVGEGSQLAEQAGGNMVEMVAAVRRVTDIIDEISAASQEQSDGIGQINQAIAQMDQVIQQNAGLVQQASAASASLADQAERLEAVVAVFRLRDGQLRSPAPALAGSRVENRAEAASPRPPLARSTAATSEEAWEEF